MANQPALTVDQNLLPVQAYFNLDGSFNTFIGQNQPFYATVNPIQSGLTITNSTIDSTTIGATTPSTGNFTNISTVTGSISTTPANSTDIVNKAYVDMTAQGYAIKAECQVATTANITLSGLQTIDGYTTLAGDRVLVKNQSLQQNNGIYVAASGAWARSSDANTYASLYSAFTFVINGSTQTNSGWVCTIPQSGTLGTTPITWSQLSSAASYFAGTGLSLSSYTFSITPVGTAETYGSASAVPVFTTNASGQVTSVTNTSITIAPSQINATIPNSGLTNSSITVNGTNIALGSSGTITAASPNALTIGTGLSGTSYNGSAPITIAIDSTVVTLTGTQTLTNKTLTSPVIGTIVNTGTLTLPTSTDTLVGRATTDTLTNKSIAAGSNTITGLTNSNLSGSAGISNGNLANSSVTVNGTNIALGASGTITANTPNALTFNNSGTGSVSGTTFNGGSAITVSYNTVGASPLAGSSSLTTVGTISSGTWNGSVIGLAYGGTNANLTATAGGVVYSTSTVLGITAAGTTGQVLTSNGTSPPTWQNSTGGGATITDDTSTNVTEYGLFSRTTSGTLSNVYTASKFNPSTGIFIAPTFSGSGANLTSIPNGALTNSTISGISLGSNLATLTIGTGLSGTSYNGSTAVTIANTGVTSLTGTASQVTVSASTGAVTLSLPSTINVNTSGNASTATNIAGGVANQIPYQTAANTTAFITAPTTSSTYLQWNGTSFVWAAAGGGGGSPGGSNTQVQYNSSGSFAGSANMTFDGTSLTLANDAKIHTLTIGLGSGSIATNTALGYQALNANTTGANLTAIGYQTLFSGTTQGKATGVGYQSGYSYAATDTYGGVYLGYQSGYYNTTGKDNVFIGGKAGYGASGSTTGGNNVAVGAYTMPAYTTGANNVVVGNSAGSITTGSNNTFIGQGAASQNPVSGSNNTAIGYHAGFVLLSNSYITAIGAYTLGNVGGNYTVGIGYGTGYSFSGSDTYGSFFGGYQAGYYNTTGADNVFIGGQAGKGVNGSTTGGSNVAIGAQALYAYTTGTQNTVIGYQAGSTLTTGSNNILLGYQAAPSAVTVSNEITIGNSSNTVLRYPLNYSTVASLPSASTVGRGSRTFVTDALAPTFQATVTGGGAVFTPVYSDGTNWKVG
jgi:hypothetical protein